MCIVCLGGLGGRTGEGRNGGREFVVEMMRIY